MVEAPAGMTIEDQTAWNLKKADKETRTMNRKLQQPAVHESPMRQVANASARISAIVGKPTGPETDWDSSAPIAFFGSISEVMREAEGTDLDIARIIIEGGNSALEFLYLLSGLRSTCVADVLWICENRSGFLSATGRGGDRILYTLAPDQVRFYLEINGLVTELASLNRGTPQRPSAPNPATRLRLIRSDMS